MAYIDANGVTHAIDNSFPVLIGRLFHDPIGILIIFVPLIILIMLFFFIKKRFEKIAIPYAIIGGILWILYFYVRTSKFYLAA